MPKKDNIKTFIDETYSKPPMGNYPADKIVYNQLDEIRSIGLADFLIYVSSNSKWLKIYS